MSDAPVRVLLVESDPVDSRRIGEALSGLADVSFHLERAGRLDEALERLGSESFAVILLDLTLPDGRGIAVFDRIFAAVPDWTWMTSSGSTTRWDMRLATNCYAPWRNGCPPACALPTPFPTTEGTSS